MMRALPMVVVTDPKLAPLFAQLPLIANDAVQGSVPTGRLVGMTVDAPEVPLV